MPELAAELAAATGTRADPASISRWLIRNGYRFKKKTLLASEQEARLRARAIRAIDALWQAIGQISDLFEHVECRNYFAAAGYRFA
jgi:hypothetical protein